MGVPHFNAPAGVIPANIRIDFTFQETRRIVLTDAQNRTIVSSFIWTQYRNVTDGQTDRRTESLWLLQRFA